MEAVDKRYFMRIAALIFGWIVTELLFQTVILKSGVFEGVLWLILNIVIRVGIMVAIGILTLFYIKKKMDNISY
ncbi:hypothetical protein HYV86_05215 [Candidatus Woesearchaeota archaeon]|nr:hypothetical protein [Candidatus Woesearchaeota archaeon]